jgi:D-glycero-alpha-D-manno-heptose-7-phosphate kinase
VSFAGGGSDLSAWLERGESGAVVNAAIGAYVYVTLSRHWHPNRIRLSYSITEDVDRLDYLSHDLVREAIQLTGAGMGLEITSVGQIPGKGSGLGSSSSTAVAVLHALETYLGGNPSRPWLAEHAIEIELVRLKQDGGKQDQYAAAFGGVNYMSFNPHGPIGIENLNLPESTLAQMSRSLPLYYTGIHRRARDVLKDASDRIRKNARTAAETRAIAGLASQAREMLIDGRVKDLGYVLDESWQRKKRLSDQVSTPDLDLVYNRALQAGATGGKLCGAGAGGFFVFCVPEDLLEAVDQATKMRRIHVKYGVPGSEIVYQDEPDF